MTNVVYLFPEDETPNAKERKAAIRAFWKVADEIAAEVVPRAFSEAARRSDKRHNPGIDDAVHLFVAAFRRQLKRSGC